MQIPAPETQTPLMRQYWDLKSQVPDSFLFVRMGDFYELFGDDAVLAAPILNITLTSRDRNKENALPMAGVPHHSAQNYIQKLLQAGKKVSIAEQMEEAGQGDLVRREIVRTFTPAIQMEAQGLDAQFLATLVPPHWTSLPAGQALRARQLSIVCVDISTGETRFSSPLDLEELAGVVTNPSIRHWIVPESIATFLQSSPYGKVSDAALFETLPDRWISPEQSDAILNNCYATEGAAGILPDPSVRWALGLLVSYAAKTQGVTAFKHLRIPSALQPSNTLEFSARTAQHLDLIPSADGNPNLYQEINTTRSSMGARLLKRWLLSPLTSPLEIRERQIALLTFQEHSEAKNQISRSLKEIYDLERLCGRIQAGLANPRDTLAIGVTLRELSSLSLHRMASPSRLYQSLFDQIETLADQLQELGKTILRTQKEQPPASSKEAGIFKLGTDNQLDHWIALAENGQQWIIELEQREREASGIPSLKVKYNRVFGYFIEITSAHAKNAPAHYQRKQTMVGSERFFTEELKKFEEEQLSASSRQRVLEAQLFEALVERIANQVALLMQAADAIATLDALIALSDLLERENWIFPTLQEGQELHLQGSRHPLLDRILKGKFIPNDLALSPQQQTTLLITGPNMGGKSTLMRQVALTVILGQVGAPVPATHARWGVFGSLFTRIGAHDAIAKGQSTFMVEMSELAYLLHHADARSLIILDEIGRGTSTYDGISVAGATLEWLAKKVRARTLFATHYHELTELAKHLPACGNAHMAVEVQHSGKRTSGTGSATRASALRFLYRLEDGPASESFGIHVAKLAGLPTGVVDRAWTILAELEAQSRGNASIPTGTEGAGHPSLFEFKVEAEEAEPLPPSPTYLDTIDAMDLNALTPMEALGVLHRLKQERFQASC